MGVCPPTPPPSPPRGVNTLTTGMTWVTPSPESITVPVRVLSPTWRDVQDAAKASTAYRKKKGNFLLIDLSRISLDRDANLRLGLYLNESRQLWICIFFTPIIMNRALNCSRERFQINAVSVSRFTRFVWTKGWFVWKSVQFWKYQDLYGSRLRVTKYSDLYEIFMAIWQHFKPRLPFFVQFMGKVFQPRK